MANLPTGTVTFLFTDIEGSTELWDLQPESTRAALVRHDALVGEIVPGHDGVLVRPRGEGDSRFAVFRKATDAVGAAAALQEAIYAEPWTTPAPLRVRIAVHTGEADLREEDYYGGAVNRCARLRSAAHGGQTLISRATYDLVRDNLPPRVGLLDLGEHRLRDLQRPEHIFQLIVEGLQSEFPPLITLDIRPNNLPTQSTLFVGREKEVEAVCKIVLQPDTRLVILTGPGGTGKTRLALQAATALIDNFTDGVYFVPLAPVADQSLVAPTIAQALGVGEAESGGDPAGNLKKYLQNKEMLLILDNFEQVVKVAPLVKEILSACPMVKVLVTSREVLHLYGEKEYAVPPLSVPTAPATRPQRLSVAQLTQYESVRLFIERARLVKSDFEVTNENAPAVAEICYRLDGLPLAIELAAARVKLLPPQAMLPRLQSRLKLLTGGAHDLPAHQQTLRGTIAWSYDLLPPEEQTLFRRMAVFAGGCALEAAEAVCNYDDAGIDVLEGISSLLDKSLLRQIDTEGEPRFFMLETLREFGLEQMEQRGEIEEVRKAHVEFYLPSSVDWQEMAGADTPPASWQQFWDSLIPERDNLRAASAWLIERSSDDVLLICTALAYFWHGRGYHSEARYLIDKALALAGAADKPGYAEALFISGVLAQVHGNMPAAGARFESAVNILRKRRLGAPGAAGAPVSSGGSDIVKLGWALGHLAMIAASQQGSDAVLDSFTQSVEELRASGDEIALGRSLIGMGTAYSFKRDHAQARSILEESLAIGRRHDDVFQITASAQLLGDVARIQGDYKEALALYEESLSLSRIVYIEAEISSMLHNMAYAELGQGNVARARELFIESLEAQRDVENKGAIAETLAGFGALAAYEAQAERALRLYGAARAIWESNHLVIWPAEQAEYERYMPLASGLVDDKTGKRAWEEGRAMSMESLDRALNYALEGEPRPGSEAGKAG